MSFFQFSSNDKIMNSFHKYLMELQNGKTLKLEKLVLQPLTLNNLNHWGNL